MNKLALVLSKIAYGISALFLGYLFFNTIHYTFVHDSYDLSEAYIFERPDSRLLNILIIVVVLVFAFIVSKIFFLKAVSKEKKDRRVFVFSIVVSAVTAILLFIWVGKTKIAPYWDQAAIYESAKAITNGDFSSLKGLYYHMYSQQLGLVFFESIILRFSNDYVIFQYLNAVFIALSVFLSSRLTHELFDSPEADFFAIVFNALFLPNFYYVSFIYGDIFSITAILFMGWLTAKWMKEKKIYYAILIVLSSMIVLPVRQNSIIFLLTIVIFLLVSALENKRLSMIVLSFAILILPLLVSNGIRLHYEKKTGDLFNNEIPSINWIVMGLQGDLYEGKGVGFYNGYNYASWNMNGCDTLASAKYSEKELAIILSNFKDDPKYAYSFLRYKLLEQWTEPTFDAVYMTVPSYETNNAFIARIYDGNRIDKLNSIMNYYLTVAYFFAFLFAIYLLLKGTNTEALLVTVFFIGTFLFSLIWEAKGRYVLPGFMIMLILSAAGLAKAMDLISTIRSKIDGRFKKINNSNTKKG